MELYGLVDCEVGRGLCPVSVLQSPSCHKVTVVRELGTPAGGGSVVTSLYLVVWLHCMVEAGRGMGRKLVVAREGGRSH